MKFKEGMTMADKHEEITVTVQNGDGAIGCSSGRAVVAFAIEEDHTTAMAHGNFNLEDDLPSVLAALEATFGHRMLALAMMQFAADGICRQLSEEGSRDQCETHGEKKEEHS